MAYSLERTASNTVRVYQDGEWIGHYWLDPLSNGYAAFKVDSPKPIARPKSERGCVLKITGGEWDGTDG